MNTYPLRPCAPDNFHSTLSHIPELSRNLLFQRSLDTKEKAVAFISPDYDTHLHNPFLMKGMKESVERLYKAIKNKEHIVVFCDYDADGIPGAVVMHDFLTKLGGVDFEIYIPHRHHEGFGLNEEAIKGFGEKNTKLLITVDCGISDVAEVAFANTLGIDVIITDHHLPHAILPPAFAILDPKQEDCNYPEKMLCGSGVAFKFVSAFLAQYGREFNVNPGWEKWLLDMVGIATLSDMVPLTGENRVFAVYGLTVLRKTRRLGLMSLLSKLKVNREHLTEDDIGFTISPRINAASRMGVPRDAFLLLSTTDAREAEHFAEHLDGINNERKGIVASMVKEIKHKLLERNHSDVPVLVIGNPDWKPALLGLAANSFAEEFSKPVFVWGRDGDGTIKGSCRSGGSVSVVTLMEKAKDMFIEFGGHSASGGFALLQDKVHFLEDALSDAYKNLNHTEEKVETLYDALLTLDEVNWETYKAVDLLAPFGMANPKPVFVFKGVIPTEVKIFGKTKNHTEIIFKNKKGKNISAIAFFNTPDAWVKLKEGEPIDLVAHIEKSVFRSFPELRLRVVDIF